MKNILVIHGHPNPTSYSAALAEAYGAAAQAQGATVRHLRLSEMQFDATRFIADGVDRGLAPEGMEPDLAAAQHDLLWSDHIAVFFPIWWTTAPALLKGFFDRALTSGFAYSYSEKGIPEGLLAGRSARVVSTMDSPYWWNLLMQGRAAHHTVSRGTLGFCGLKPVRQTTHYNAKKRGRLGTESFLRRVQNDASIDAQDAPKAPQASAPLPSA